MEWLNYIFTPLISVSASIIAALIIAKGAVKAAKKGAEMTAEVSRESVRETLEGRERRDKNRQQEIIQGVLQAIYEELNAIYNQLNSRSEEYSMEKVGEVKDPYYYDAFTVTQDYSIIYRSNANLIGQIKSSDLRRGIVKTYKLLDVLMEIYKTNNRLIIQWQEAGKTGNRGLATTLFSQIRDITPELREMHNLSMKLTKELLDLLERELSQGKEWDSGSCQR